MSESPPESALRSNQADGGHLAAATRDAAHVVLAQTVAAALGDVDTRALTATLSTRVRDTSQYEASVRRGRNGSLRAGRMMIERASAEILGVIAEALQVTLPPAAKRWRQLAEHEGLPLIVGWDVRDGGEARCVKLYVNASDAAAATRNRLLAMLAPGLTGRRNLAAIMGMNVNAGGFVETKLYVQSADVVELAADMGAGPRSLAAAARDELADAGGIVSFDASGSDLRPRAFFVALREPREVESWRCVRSLPAYDAQAVAALLPFVAAPPRSVGLSLHDGSWTLYSKPRGSGRGPETLEPFAVFRAGDVELGVFIEPTARGRRAFRRTERHAVSVRPRAGEPEPAELERLVDWFVTRLRAAERSDGESPLALEHPPPPWRLVSPTKPPSLRGNGS